MFNELLQWIRPSLEGNDKKSSARAITNFWYVGLNTAITVCTVILAFDIAHQLTPTEQAVSALKILVQLCVIFNIVILLIFGIVSAQQLIQAIRSFRGEKIETDGDKTKLETTEVVTGS